MADHKAPFDGPNNFMQKIKDFSCGLPTALVQGNPAMGKRTMDFTYDISKLAQRKARLGWTNMRLAQAARVHGATVSNVLSGRTCKPPTVKKLAEAMGLDLTDLVVCDKESA
jgi:hypothetical protein